MKKNNRSKIVWVVQDHGNSAVRVYKTRKAAEKYLRGELCLRKSGPFFMMEEDIKSNDDIVSEWVWTLDKEMVRNE